ncbi:hypothetical protein ABL78_2775 [Leptomonas seymouri]|uniref:PH-like domain-containing protein n=1 Tax=Leptomonas seymouri TaxID=5684 RepID=A0A0N1ILQ5_LEPSE|nr:hypothetical protein ABL78_2775 [Leptomonas seymouri]|eukprot:KPI88142.1 hypothetical protein ABL78_2775 [Leptomonas seymouri]
MDSRVPRLQLNTSRYSNAYDRVETGSRLNHTAAPLSTLGVSGVGYGGVGSSSNNNTSMTNNTMNSDAYNDCSCAAGAAPPSPIPRFSDSLMGRHSCFGDTNSYASPSQGWSELLQRRYNQPLEGDNVYTAASGFSRSTPRPSATRPLFVSESASNPRDTNVITGDTGCVPPWDATRPTASGAGLEPREDFLNRYRRLYPSKGLFSRPASAPGNRTSRDGYASLWGNLVDRGACTSTYVRTSSRVMPSKTPAYFGSGGGAPDFDWRGGTRPLATGDITTATTFREEQRPYRSENVSGLVNSRSRARADRWTDETVATPDGPLPDHFGDDTTSLDAVAPPSDASFSKASYDERRSRRRRRGGGGGSGRRRHGDDRENASEDSDDMWNADDADSLSFADAVVQAMDEQPVVPLELLRRAQETPFVWIRHPSHVIILALLQHRGIYLPRYRELVDYHMAELFLHYLDLCREGAYFVYYMPSKWPKERFFRIRMLPVNRLESGTESVPHLVVTLHESGVHILDAIPLDNLVGVTLSPQAACFRPFLESPNTIIGCREGRGHRARMPVDGAFSLWFYDIRQHTSRSVDILTCNAKVFDIWTKTFRGLVSVNSSSVVQVAMTPHGESAELAGLAQAAQKQNEIEHGERKGKLAEDA